MAKNANQKLKLLYLTRILLEETDEDHPLTVVQLIDRLAANGISAERKSIYSDLEALRTFGLDVVQIKSRSTGYYIGSRNFELPELKLLVDCVQSSKFITYKKTMSLIKKIEALASTHQASLLQRQVYVRNRVKSMNESVYYNIDEISNAINEDKAIRFLYFEYQVDKERHYRKDGAYYYVSPFALLWDDENYYLLAWDDEAAMLKHYRVDKMTDIQVLEQHRAGKAAFEQLDMSAYNKMVFGMFTGSEQRVTMRFANYLAGAVLDRFGKDIYLDPCGEDSFYVTVPVEVSPHFFAWIFAFGRDGEIVNPPHVRRELRRRALDIAELNR